MITPGTDTPLTMREALRLIWLATTYPCLGNGDFQIAERMEAEAFKRAETAVQAHDDAPEFAGWIAALRDPHLPNDEREEVLSTIYDVFDPDRD